MTTVVVVSLNVYVLKEQKRDTVINTIKIKINEVKRQKPTISKHVDLIG